MIMSSGHTITELLPANSICQGFVYLNVSTRRILLCHPGTWIDTKLSQKLEQFPHKIDYESVVDETLKENFKNLINAHQKMEFETDLAVSKDKILQLFNSTIERQEEFLHWSIACFECFNKVDTVTLNTLHETDLKLLRKAHFSSALAIWISLGNGLYDPRFLEDIYQLTFLQDSGLIDPAYSYYITLALDQELMQPGQGLSFLYHLQAGSEEISLYKNHPLASLHFIKNLNILNNNELVRTVLFGHELKEGEGFPFALSGSVLAVWEKILILADQLVKYNSNFKYDLMREITDLRTVRLSFLPIEKILQRSLATLPCLKQEESA